MYSTDIHYNRLEIRNALMLLRTYKRDPTKSLIRHDEDKEMYESEIRRLWPLRNPPEDTVEKLQQENERLKAALRIISEWDAHKRAGLGYGISRKIDWYRDIARKAIENSSKETP